MHCNFKPTPAARHMNCRRRLASEAAGSPSSIFELNEAPTLSCAGNTSRAIYQRPKCERKYHFEH